MPLTWDGLKACRTLSQDGTQVNVTLCFSANQALLAAKADVREELDRLWAHMAAARDLMTQDGAIGRKLDFLCQELNREVNTLCSKSSDMELTNIGLDLKTAVEQMREQVQNIE